MPMAPSSMSLSEPQRKSPSPAEVLLGNHGIQEKINNEKIVFRNKFNGRIYNPHIGIED
jgi:hypothetical protein